MFGWKKYYGKLITANVRLIDHHIYLYKRIIYMRFNERMINNHDKIRLSHDQYNIVLH